MADDDENIKSIYKEKLNSDYDSTREIVKILLDFIKKQFNSLGMDDFHKLVNPSLEDLMKYVMNMQKIVLILEKKLVDIETDDSEIFLNSMRIQNIKQGLLYAENLLFSIKNYNRKECKEYLDKLDKNNI